MELPPLSVLPFDSSSRSYNYDEEVLSKFHQRPPPPTQQQQQQKQHHISTKSDGLSHMKTTGDRYFKLIMQENASKEWNPDKDGYFQHLDPPPPTPPPPVRAPLSLKCDPSSSSATSTPTTTYSLSSNHCNYDDNINKSPTFSDIPILTKGQASPSKGYNGEQLVPQQSHKRPAEMEMGHLEEMSDSKIHKSARLVVEPEQQQHQSSVVVVAPTAAGPPSDEGGALNESEEPQRNIDRKDVFFVIVEHPLKHQVKEFNILPGGILQLMRHYQSTPSDYIVVKLVCDPKMDKGEIFLTAVSTHYSQNAEGEIAIPSLKVSQKMLPGRTKGFTFRLLYELVIGGKVTQSSLTEEFFIWSNVNQKGYPRKERDAFITQRIESNKKKVRATKRKTPGRPRKTETDEIDFEEE